MKKKVLVLGSGGREHALVWSFCNDKNVKKVYCAPGNGGTSSIAENITVNLANHQEIIRLVREKEIDLTVVGPENPLANGIVDIFHKEGLRIFGPDAYGAQLESSKLFARDLMSELNILQPSYYSCDTKSDIESLKNILGLPLVLKADGLAAGKGVIICKKEREYQQALIDIFDLNQFGSACNRISLEKYLDGEELSVFAVCDGEKYSILNSAKDHKRIFDNDKGPNTGGMGAFSPTSLATEKIIDRVGKEIIQPILNEMINRGHPYIGFLYVGLMIVNDNPYVIEFNVRLGDPESQVIIPLLKSSLFELLWNATEGKLQNSKINISNKVAVTVVLASEGYPGKYKTGYKIKGLDSINDKLIFHAGTQRQDHDFVTTGGRVLNVVGIEENLSSAIKDVYTTIKNIDYEGKIYRKDIGATDLKKKKKGK